MVAGSSRAMRVCPSCGKQTPADDPFCVECGADASAPIAAASQPVTATAATGATAAGASAGATGAATTASAAATAPVGGESGATSACPNCGRQVRAGARFCPFCRAALAPGVLAVGQVLGGRYRVTGIIGGGGMGAVYRGVDVNLPTREEPEGRSCAIKAILNTNDPELLAAAALEREMLIRLDDPHIVRIYDIITQNGVPFIVMALVRGTGWKQLLEQHGGAMPPSLAVRMVLGILPAFSYLHRRTPPVVYRDFKPGNAIQVHEDDGVLRQVLIDLGTAMEYQPGRPVQAWGTPGYAPPEIRGVCEQTPAMDVYTIVSALAEMVGLDLEAWQKGGVPPREQWPLPEELYDLLHRGRSPNPAERFQSIAELEEQLEGVARFIVATSATGVAGAAGGMRGDSAVPVRSRLFTGSIGHRTTSRINALPATITTDPAAAAVEQAKALLTAGRYTQALSAAEAALAANPNSVDGRLVKAVALTDLGRPEEARAELQAAGRATAPAQRWRTIVVEAQTARAMDDLPTAERLYTELIRIVPGEILPKQALADLYRESGRHAEAVELYRRVVQADPANADAILGLADSLVALGHPDEAVEALSRVGENAVRFTDAELRLVELYLARVRQQPDDLNRAAAALQALGGRAAGGRYFRLLGDWWFAAYELARGTGSLPPIEHWPDGMQHSASDRAGLARRCREAYFRYLRQEPEAADADEVLDRIFFGVQEWL